MSVASSYRKLRRSVVIKPPIAFSQPNTLIYRRLDRPPPPALAVLALQHAALISVFLVVAVTVARLAGLSADVGRNFLALTMIAVGAGAILQSLGSCGIGLGYLRSEERSLGNECVSTCRSRALSYLEIKKDHL